jgi:hypothetical protein
MCKGAGRAGRPSTPYWGHQMAHPHAHGRPPHFVITPACWIGHGPPTQKDESQVVWGSNRNAFSNVDPCALPRASGPRSRHPRWPSACPSAHLARIHAAIANSTHQLIHDAHQRCSQPWGGGALLLCDGCKGGSAWGCMGPPKPSGRPPSPSLAPTPDPEHTTSLKDQITSYVARGGALRRPERAEMCVVS